MRCHVSVDLLESGRRRRKRSQSDVDEEDGRRSRRRSQSEYEEEDGAKR